MLEMALFSLYSNLSIVFSINLLMSLSLKWPFIISNSVLRCILIACFILFDQQSKIQRYSVYYHCDKQKHQITTFQKMESTDVELSNNYLLIIDD